MRGALILAQGRLKEPLLEQTCAEYFQRCRRTLKLELKEVRSLTNLKRAIPERSTLIALDERGEQLTSMEFARQLGRWIERPLPLVFLIGGAEGLDAELRDRADQLLSLGRMTFAHRLVRLLLAEQIYRAVSILDGSPYHREG